MEADSVMKFILESFRDGEVVKAFIDHILDDILTPALKFRDEEIQELRKQLKAKNDELTDLKLKLDDQEQYNRKHCLVVKGVSERNNEDANKVVTELAAAAGVEIAATDIDVGTASGAVGQPELPMQLPPESLTT